MPDLKFFVTEEVDTPDGLGRIGEFDTNGANELMAKVWVGSHPRWYKVTDLKHL